MAVNPRPKSEETERSEVLVVKDQADRTAPVAPASLAAGCPSATIHEEDCRPPGDTIRQLDPIQGVTVWVATNTGVAGPCDDTVVAEPLVTSQLPGTSVYLPTVEGYEILSELGRGSMGIVYKARQFRLNRICALKMMISGTQADLPIAGRFQGEAESLASLLHPNVVQIFSIGESNGILYLELEYVEGGSLFQQLAGTPKPADESATLIRALAGGVAAIHRRDLVHRDLKPANILLAADGTPKVADFGLVKVRSSAATLTPQGSILGSPSYMAPEQAEGRGEAVGPAADIYGLGAILYEMLTGRPPFRGATIHQTIRQVISTDPILPSRLTPGLPRDIETICLKCLQKRPVDRYATAADLAEDLRRFLAREPILARPVPLWERSIKWARRRPGAAFLVSALTITLVGFLIFGIWSYAEIAHHLKQAEIARALAVAETYGARLSETRALIFARPAGWREIVFANLDVLASMATTKRDPIELRTVAASSLGGIDVRELARLDVCNPVRSLDFSPDSGSLATADYGGRLRIWDVKTFKHLAVVDDPASNGTQYTEESPTPAVRYRPGGGGLFYATYGCCVEWYDPAHPEAKRKSIRGRSQPCSIAFDASGRRMAISWIAGWITVHDTETGLLRRSIVAPVSWHTNPVALSPDGQWVVGIDNDFRVQLHPTETSGPPITLGRHTGHIRSLAFSLDGKTLASASLDQTVKLWDMTRREEKHTLRGHTARLNSVAFHPDGEFLASASDDRTVRLWDAKSGAALLIIRPEVESVLSVAFSPDGNSLACGHGTICVYALTGLREHRRYHGLPHEIFGVAFHPRDPRIVVVGGATHDLHAIDVVGGRSIQQWRGGSMGAKPLGSVAVSPVGGFVATGSGKFGGGVVDPDFSVNLWKIDDGSHLKALEGHDNPVEALTFNAEGTLLASGSKNGTLIVWELPAGRKAFEGQIGKRNVPSVGFLDGDARLIAGDEEGRIAVIDLQSGVTIRSARVSGGVARFVVVPGSDRLFVGGGDGALFELRLSDLATIQKLEGAHQGPVMGMAATPDGKMLVTGGGDRRVSLRGTQTLAELFSLPPYDGAIFQVAVSSDGVHLAVGGVENRLDVWNLSLIAAAFERLGLAGQAVDSRSPMSTSGQGLSRKVERDESPIDQVWSLMGKAETFRAEGGHASEALELYRQAVTLWEGMLRNAPTNLFYQSELAVSYAALADLAAQIGRADESERALKRALEMIATLYGNDSRIAFARCRVLSLACKIDPKGRASCGDRAMIALRQALAGGYKDRRQIDENPDLVALRSRADFGPVIDVYYSTFGWPYLLNRGRSLALQGRVKEAIVDFEQTRAILRELREADPSNPWLARKWAVSTVDVASVHLKRGSQWAESLAEAVVILEALAEKSAEADLALARAHSLLAESAGSDHADQAMTALKRAVAEDGVDLEFLEKDLALRTISGRDDFRGLVADLAFPVNPF